MPKRKQKKEEGSEEKRRTEDTSSSYVLLETDLRRRDLPAWRGVLSLGQTPKRPVAGTS
jgi:hypothetical protein